MTHPVMLTAAEVADCLGLTRSQVYRRIGQGRLPAVRARRDGKQCWLVSADDVRAFKDSGVDLGPIENPELMRIPAAARVLGCSPEHVRLLVRRGDLAAKRGEGPRSHIRILRSAVDEYLSTAV